MDIVEHVERRMRVLKAWATSLVMLFALAAIGCANTNSTGNALLPDGIDAAQVPRVDSMGYVYFNPGSPVVVSDSLFNVGLSNFDNFQDSISMDHATLILGNSTDNVGASLHFSTVEDGQLAWQIIDKTLDAEEFWGRNLDERVLLATGDQAWRESLTRAYAAGDMVSVKENSKSSWKLLSNLPESPPSKPVMAGVLKLDANMLQSLMTSVELEAEGIGNAFGLVRVDSLAFAVYTDDPLHMSTEFSHDRLVDSGSGILFVSQSTYPGPVVSFMLGVMSDRTNLDLIKLASTNARYRMVDDLHLIIKNRGSLLYAAIATTRSDAEALMLTALYD